MWQFQKSLKAQNFPLWPTQLFCLFWCSLIWGLLLLFVSAKSQLNIMPNPKTEDIVKALQAQKNLLLSCSYMRSILLSTQCPTNSCHDRLISDLHVSDIPAKVRFSPQMKHPSQVMMFGLMSSDGKKMSPVFLDFGLRLDSKLLSIGFWCFPGYKRTTRTPGSTSSCKTEPPATLQR